MELCLQNSSPDSKVVSDEGLFLMAAKKINNVYYTQAVQPTLEGVHHMNNCLGWTYLHKTYHRHERLQLNGYMNGVYQQFLSTRPVKKRTRIGIGFCCGDMIDLTGKVKSNMGDALIGGASFLLYHEEMELDLVYADTIGNIACLKPSKFSFHHFDAGFEAFYFETLFATGNNFITEIEAIKPDGSKQIFNYNPDTAGVYPATFPPYFDGLWRFRKRLVCDVQFESPWTDWITVDTTASGGGTTNCTANALPAPDFISHFNNTRFQFRFLALTIIESVEVEVTRPNSSVSIKAGDKTIFNGGTDVSVNAANAGENSIPSGHYRFRFRKICDAANGIYSPWSNYVDVNI